MLRDSNHKSPLVQQLLDAWREQALETRQVVVPARFGDIYLAPLAKFADGNKHFGMVRARKKGLGSVIRFSPVTSKRPSGFKAKASSLFIPAKTSLSRDSTTQRLSKDSWMLLGLGPIPVLRADLQADIDSHRARYIGWLPESWISCVRAKLEENQRK